MVSTRKHPSDFPPSPTHTSYIRRSSSPPTSPTPRISNSKLTWTHTPSHLTLLWLMISLPLVIWDTLYVLLRPHTMPGGSIHAPLWKPYELYGRVDYIYGWPAWNERNGFTAAQGALNAVETAGYLLYLWIVLEYGRSPTSSAEVAAQAEESKGAPAWFAGVPGLRWLLAPRHIGGREAAWAVLLGLSISVMTLSKTVLYWLQEYFGDYRNIGHNDAWSLVVLWIVPNGAWIVLPTYMTYVFGSEVLDGLETASTADELRERKAL